MIDAIQKIREALDYDPETGVFNRRDHEGRCGTVTRTGYLQISIAGRLYLAHRLAWLLSYGRWPIGDLDHIDRDRMNNRLSNLREATRSQNIVNSVCRAPSNTGIRNVYVRYYKDSAYYVVRIKNKYVAQFRSLAAAGAYAAKARDEAYGEFNPAKAKGLAGAPAVEAAEALLHEVEEG